VVYIKSDIDNKSLSIVGQKGSIQAYELHMNSFKLKINLEAKHLASLLKTKQSSSDSALSEAKTFFKDIYVDEEGQLQVFLTDKSYHSWSPALEKWQSVVDVNKSTHNKGGLKSSKPQDTDSLAGIISEVEGSLEDPFSFKLYISPVESVKTIEDFEASLEVYLKKKMRDEYMNCLSLYTMHLIKMGAFIKLAGLLVEFEAFTTNMDSMASPSSQVLNESFRLL
jgi:hypothetical protein